ncbi:MAG: hypothetical protein K2X91_00185, partial [Thermoleophilia bacterium]|nr:hypothetical protein [Thermoleophilia bacterium]
MTDPASRLSRAPAAHRALAFLAPWLFALATNPGAVLAGPAPAPAEPSFVGTLTDGTAVRGRLVAVDEAGAFVLDRPEGGKQAVPLDRLVKLTREGAPLTLRPEGSVLLFPDG